MKYFITEYQRKETGSTCFFEFQKGQKRKKYKCCFWKEDSLLLHMEIVDKTEIYKIFPDFNYFGITIIDKQIWDVVLKNAENKSGEVNDIMNELSEWVEINFREFEYFVILGV